VQVVTSLASVISFIAIELQRQAGMDCKYRRNKKKGSLYGVELAFDYIDKEAGLLAAKAAIRMVESLLKNNEVDVSTETKKIQERWEKVRLGQLTECIVDEVIKRKIPFLYLTNKPLIQLGYGQNQKRIQSSVTNHTSSIGVKLAGNKEQTKNFLKSLGVPVPTGKLISEESSLADAIDFIGYPVVLKPPGGNQGRGVSVNINNYEDAINAFHTARRISGSRVIVEKFIRGSDYRLLVINYKFVAATKRTPAMIIGNGHSTISELINIVNSDPRRGEGHSKPLSFIKVDEATRKILRNKGLSVETILPNHEPLFLKSIANLSAGGTSMDVTELVHPHNVLMAERITKIIGLDICGLDIITPDIAIPINTDSGAVVEVNSAPGFRLHMEPAEGIPRNAAGSVIDMLFPENTPSRIPIIAVTGSYNTTMICSLIVYLMNKLGYKVGSATAKGIYIQNILIQKEDSTNCENTQLVLKDPTIDFAVFECSPLGILENGLGFYNCDIGIVVDAKAIPNIDISNAISVVPASVLPTGYAILNADNEVLYQMHSGLDCKVVFFSVNGNNPHIAEHLEKGGCAAVVENDYINIYTGLDKIKLLKITEIQYQSNDLLFIENVILPFILSAFVQNISIEDIKGILTTDLPLKLPF